MTPACAGDHAKSKWGYLTGDVRQKYMPPAIVHFESHAYRRGVWRDAMLDRTTEVRQKEYSEAEITTTAMPDRRASCHSNNIREARREMISGFLNPALATRRPKRNTPGRMKPQAAIRQRRSKVSGNTISSLRDHVDALNPPNGLDSTLRVPRMHILSNRLRGNRQMIINPKEMIYPPL